MILDIILVVLLVFGALHGYKKGLVGILVSLVSLVLSIVLAFVLQGPMSTFLYQNTPLGNSIETSVTTMVQDNVNNQTENKNMIVEMFMKEAQADNKIESVSHQITMYILRGIAFVSILIIVFIVCSILQTVLNLVFDLPVLNIVNKLGGATLSMLKSLIGIWILFAILSLLQPIPGANHIENIVKSGSLSKLIYENNFLVKIISSNMQI